MKNAAEQVAQGRLAKVKIGTILWRLYLNEQCDDFTGFYLQQKLFFILYGKVLFNIFIHSGHSGFFYC